MRQLARMTILSLAIAAVALAQQTNDPLLLPFLTTRLR